MKKKIILFSSLFFLVDLISKSIIKNTLNLYQKIEVIPSFFRITYVINDGAAFSILKGQQIFFIILAIVLLIFLSYYLKKEHLTKYKVIYYSLLIGGVLGNLWDRIIYKGVIDFLDFKIINYEAPIFNLADTFIFCSVVLIILENLKGVLWKSK